MATLEFWVNGMTCAHCERAITAELSLLVGVEEVQVNAVSGRVRLTHAAPLGRLVIARAIEDAGYELKSWSTDHDD